MNQSANEMPVKAIKSSPSTPLNEPSREKDMVEIPEASSVASESGLSTANPVASSSGSGGMSKSSRGVSSASKDFGLEGFLEPKGVAGASKSRGKTSSRQLVVPPPPLRFSDGDRYLVSDNIRVFCMPPIVASDIVRVLRPKFPNHDLDELIGLVQMSVMQHRMSVEYCAREISSAADSGAVGVGCRLPSSVTWNASLSFAPVCAEDVMKKAPVSGSGESSREG